MKKGDLIFHKSLKFGVIDNIEGLYYTINFLDYGQRVISEDFLKMDDKMIVEIPDYFINKINSEDFFESYKLTTIEKGEDYYHQNLVKNFYIKNKKFFAKVEGNNIYDVEISFSRESSCTCPVGYKCKHSVAAFLKLRDNIKELTSLRGNEIENDFNFSKYFLFTKDDYIEQFPIKRFQNIKNDILALDDISFNNFVNEAFNKYNKDRVYSFIKNYCIFFMSIKELTNRVAKILNTPEHADDRIIFNRIKRETTLDINKAYYKNDVLSSLNGLLLEDKYEEAFNALFDNCSHINFDNYYYDEILSNLSKDYINDNFEIIYKNLKVINFDKIKKILNYLNLNNSLKLYIQRPSLIEDINVITNFPVEAQFSILNEIDPNLSYSFILDNYNNLMNYPKELANIVIRLIKIIKTKARKASLCNIISNLPHERYLLFLLETNDLFFNEKRLMEEPLNDNLLSRPSYMKINSDDLFYYFDLNYFIHTDDNNFYLDIELVFNDTNIAKIELIDMEKESLKSIDSFNNLNIANYCLDYVLDNYKEDINNKYQLFINEKEARELELSLKEINKSLDVIERDTVLTDLNSNPTVRLEVELVKIYSGLSLELKIGNEQLYKVKDLLDFVMLFINNEEKKYGKKLTFKHDIDYLEKPYDEFIKYLMEIFIPGGSYYYQSSYRNSLNDKNLKKILYILKNTYLKFHDVNYLLSLDPIDVKYIIDDEYKLQLSGIDNKNLIILMDDTYFYFDKDNQKINVLNINKKEYPLFKLFIQNQNKTIKPIKEKIRDVIVSRYTDKIELSEKIKSDFKIVDLDIDAYFDWTSYGITVSNKYSKNNIPLNIDEISNISDLSKLNTYQNYLKNLGFIDGVMSDEDNQIKFLKMDFSYLRSIATVYLSDALSNKTITQFKTPIVRIQYNNNMLDAFVTESEYSEDELKEIYRALKRKRKYVVLGSNNIVDLDNEETNEFYQTVTDLNLNQKEPNERNYIPTYQVIKAYAHINNCQIDDYLSNMVNEIKEYKNFDIELPSINAELRDYQVVGYKWLSILKKYHIGGILADDMGLGKTLQIITLILADNSELPSLIVCPKSLVFNWKNEFNKFAPQIEAIEIYGGMTERRNIISQIDPNKKVVYIISYDSLGRDLDYLNHYFNFLVLDEAQTIKNVNAKKSINVKQVNACYRYALTGTPIENNVIDLWSIFDFLMPEYFDELSKFKSRYLNDTKYTDYIAKMVAPFILRRTKKDVLKDLPSKYERIVTCEMSKEQRKIYDSICNEALDRLYVENKKSIEVLALLTRLRQVCIDPNLFIENYNSPSAKLELLKELLKEYLFEGHRILIFSQFVSALKLVEEYLEEMNIKYYMITGDTDAKKRLELANNFNSSNDIPVFLISLKAGGTGLNLIGADTVIHLDPWWNSSAEDQATDRAYRIGQTKNVEVIKLICEDSIEQRVIELQNIKKDIIDKLIANDDQRISSISIEDLQFILKK